MPKQYHERHVRGLSHWRKTGESRLIGKILELSGIRKDGTEFPIELSLSTWQTEGDRYFTGIIRDITDRKRAAAELRKHQDKLQSLASQMCLVEERERRRIAADLHDGIVQSLGLSCIKLGTLRQRIATEDYSIVDEVRALIDQMIRDTRLLVYELSPPILYELGFEAAVEWLVERLEDQYGIACVLKIEGPSITMGNDIGILLFHAVRELLINVSKHAQAAQARLSLEKDSDQIRICVEDNGVGFDTSTVGSHSYEGKGFGLFSIGERLDLFGGTLEIESTPGQGTRVTLTTPLNSEK